MILRVNFLHVHIFMKCDPITFYIILSRSGDKIHIFQDRYIHLWLNSTFHKLNISLGYTWSLKRKKKKPWNMQITISYKFYLYFKIKHHMCFIPRKVISNRLYLKSSKAKIKMFTHHHHHFCYECPLLEESTFQWVF